MDKLLVDDEILIKRLSKSVKLPKYETKGSSGMDLSANINTNIKIEPGEIAIIPTEFQSQYLKILRYKLDQGQD